jgi:5-methylcytosine-specific restriction endonuclease McrA
MSRPGAALVAEVRRRAGGRCEYCHFPVEHASLPFEVEHVIPRKHEGATEPENLAFACFYCNRYKGPNIAGSTRPGAPVTRLFHPRIDRWDEHFEWQEAILSGRSEIGAVTIKVLRINQPNAVAVRQLLIHEGLWKRE